MHEILEYIMPQTIKSERADILFLISLFDEIMIKKCNFVFLDFKHTRFFASELYSLYHYYIKELKKQGIYIHAKNVAEDVDYVNHLSDKYKDEDEFPNHNTVILPHDFSEELLNGNYDSFDEYVKRELLSKVKNDDNISNIVIPYLSELFVNSRTHGNTNNVLCAGQIYSYTNKMRFIIVDFGVGIPYNIENHPIFGKKNYYKDNDAEAIKWSTQEGTSTKTTLGGLGLSSIKEFIDETNGRLLIISRNGAYERQYSRDRINNSRIKFNGTLVVVELDLMEIEKIKKPNVKKEVFSI